MKRGCLLLLLCCINYVAWGVGSLYYPNSITSASLTSGAVCVGVSNTIKINYSTGKTGGTGITGIMVTVTVYQVSASCSSCTGGTALSGIAPATFTCAVASSGGVSIVIPASDITTAGTNYYYVEFSGSEPSVYSSSVTLTVNPLPAVSAITGTTGLCPGNSATLSDTATGGTWSSTKPSVATVNSAGLVTAVAIGTDTIKYSKTNGCGTAAASKVMTVNANAWTGATSANWNTTTNWACGKVPTASTPAVIQAGIINMPVISEGTEKVP